MDNPDKVTANEQDGTDVKNTKSPDEFRETDSAIDEIADAVGNKSDPGGISGKTTRESGDGTVDDIHDAEEVYIQATPVPSSPPSRSGMKLGAALAVFLVVIMLLLAGSSGTFEDWFGDDNDDNNHHEDPPNHDYPYDDVRNFTVIDLHTNETYESWWAVFHREHGGNGAEHYLATTHNGWITNLGGEYPTWSTDRGLTWHQFTPISEPFDGLGEGAIIETPDGDIVANSWYPYPPYPDELISYYYSADADSWYYMYKDNTHAPFYDRSWQCVVPGPITSFQGNSPWASLIVSNFWSSSGIGYLISQDGLNYILWDDPSQAQGTVSFPLDFDPGIMWDFMIPHREMDAVPIPTGGLLMPKYFNNGDSAFLDTNLIWRRYREPEGVTIPAPHLVIDSTGALHSVAHSGKTLTHHMSQDGGRTWESHRYSWEYAKGIEEWEFQADGAHGLAVLNVRIEVTENGEDVDKDLIYHVRDYRESLEPDSLTYIGQGDADATSGLGNEFRFDFASLAILPDGGVVVSYQDSTDIDPLFAVELEMPY